MNAGAFNELQVHSNLFVKTFSKILFRTFWRSDENQFANIRWSW